MEDEWNVDRLLVELRAMHEATVLEELLAVVGGEQDERAVVQAVAGAGLVRSVLVTQVPAVVRPTLLGVLSIFGLLAALFGAQPTHLHAAFDSPDLCATCSWSLHAPTTLSTPVAVDLEPALVVTIVPWGST